MTLRKTALVLKGVSFDKEMQRDHLEAVGRRDAFLYVQQIVSKKKSRLKV